MVVSENGYGDRARASRPDQVHANAAASGVDLGEDTLAEVDAVLVDVAVTEPRLAICARQGVRRR